MAPDAAGPAPFGLTPFATTQSAPSLMPRTPSAAPAGMRARIVARLVDGVVVGAVCLALALPTAEVLGAVYGLYWIALVRLVFVALWVVIGGCYEVSQVTSRRQTIGMRTAGVAVVDAVTGGRTSTWRAVKRWGILTVCELFMPLYVLLCLSPMFDPSGRRQGWHDKACSTAVVRA